MWDRTRPRCLLIAAALALVGAAAVEVVAGPGSAAAVDEAPPVEWAEVLGTPGAGARFWATNVAVGSDGTIVVAAGAQLSAYAPDGTHLWTDQVGADPRDVAIDAAGDVVVVGALQEPGTFGTGDDAVELSPPLSSGGTFYELRGFIAKYGAAGGLLWAKADGSYTVFPEAVATTPDRRIITAGGMDSSFRDVVVGSGSNEIMLEGTGAFVATYSAGGVLQDAFAVEWTDLQFFPTVEEPRIVDLELQQSGDIVLAGTASRAFASTFLNTTSAVSRMFLASATPSGSVHWAHTTNLDTIFQAIGTFHTAYGGLGGMAIDANGNIVVTGGFTDPGCDGCTRTFGTGARALELEAEFVDVFVASYDSDGLLNWAQAAGGGAEDVGSDVVARPGGSFLVAGRYAGYTDTTFGTGDDALTVPPFDESLEGTFVAEYSGAGELAWVHHHERRDPVGNTILNGDVSGPRIAVGPGGGLAVNDILEEPITIGDGSGALTLTPTVSPNDVYLARFAGSGADAGLVPLVPARLVETRSGPGLVTVDGQYQGIGVRGPGSETEVQIAGRDGVPGDASAVMLNVTAVVPAGPGFVTVWPCGEPRPVASNVNYGPGDVVPNSVFAKIGDGGTVCFYTLAATHLVVDVNGVG